MMRQVKTRIHCIGIGGAGMAPLAELLHARGWQVSGSDRQQTPVTSRLEQLGIAVQYGHAVDLVAQAKMVIYSSAIRDENAERVYARAHSIAEYRRAEIVGDLMRSGWSVAVSGTHGKTTTTALVGHMLAQVGLDPTVLVGGEVIDLGSHARIGSEALFVTEADEYDRSFLCMHPSVAILNNIEADHLDCYRDIHEIHDAFVEFANHVPFFGAVIAMIDDPGVRAILPRIRRRVVTCGLSGDADLRAEYAFVDGALRVAVSDRERRLGTMSLRMAGEHNVRNALMAAAAAMQCGVSFDRIAAVAGSFGGVRRRLEIVGECAGVSVFDDYAHHPSEIQASLSGLRSMGFTRLVVIFQPHLYSRTRDFLDGFAASLAAADMAIVLDIYAAREEALAGVSAEAIVRKMTDSGHTAVQYCSDAAAGVRSLIGGLRKGDAVVCMGAGDVNKWTGVILEGLRHGA